METDREVTLFKQQFVAATPGIDRGPAVVEHDLAGGVTRCPQPQRD